MRAGGEVVLWLALGQLMEAGAGGAGTTGGVTTPSAALIVSTPQKELDTF